VAVTGGKLLRDKTGRGGAAAVANILRFDSDEDAMAFRGVGFG